MCVYLYTESPRGNGTDDASSCLPSGFRIYKDATKLLPWVQFEGQGFERRAVPTQVGRCFAERDIGCGTAVTYKGS